MTSREIDWRIKAMGKRREENFKIDAALHGVKLKEKVNVPQLSDDQERNLDKIIQDKINGVSNGRR